MGVEMDYFTVGARPFLWQFPPCVSRIVTQTRLYKTEDADHGNDCGVRTLCAEALVKSVEEPVDRHIEMVGTAKEKATFGPHPHGGRRSRGGCHRRGNGRNHPWGQSDVQEAVEDEVKTASGTVKAPDPLHSAFDPAEVQMHDPNRFEMLQKLQNATRNRGQVHLMQDHVQQKLVAVKRMPNNWIQSSHKEFIMESPRETELPWQDIGCNRFLNSVGFPFGCSLYGVFRGQDFTDVVTSFATEGDLFAWCSRPSSPEPGPEREALVRPVAKQILQSVQQLHEMQIVHRDLSLENILMSKLDEDGTLGVKLIDFGMASTSRKFQNSVRGKASYQAPEIHDSNKEYDAFLSDAFAVGVSLYAVLMKDYPWLSTRPGGCKCFEYVRRHGFRAYVAKRKLRNSTRTVADHMSEPLINFLEGLLSIDPAKRLTLGESTWNDEGGRRSVWDEPWAVRGAAA